MPPSNQTVATTALALAACAAVLAGCSSDKFGRTLGFIHDAPDEFTVTTRAPLAMPTSFALPPPTPGATRPQEQSERTQAELALVPQMALGAPDAAGTSPGPAGTGAGGGPAGGRPISAPRSIRRPCATSPAQGFVDKLMFWRTPPQPGIVVDPQKEAQRLRENSALGQSQETGDTPIVQPKQRGWLEGIF